jgi:hypothetical protein
MPVAIDISISLESIGYPSKVDTPFLSCSLLGTPKLIDILTSIIMNWSYYSFPLPSPFPKLLSIYVNNLS